jgi:hypothetical protein
MATHGPCLARPCVWFGEITCGSVQIQNMQLAVAIM